MCLHIPPCISINRKLLPDIKQTIKDTEAPLYFIEDSAYPMLTWLMKPFPHYGMAMSVEQRTYNYCICRVRIVVENAFGRLKVRWYRVSKRLDANVDNTPTIITKSLPFENLLPGILIVLIVDCDNVCHVL